jgi:signal transduction histidine kinase
VAFVVLMINSFHYIEEQFTNLTEQRRVIILKTIEHETQTWLLERVTNIENSAKFISEIYDDEDKLKAFIATFMKNNKSFDAIQVLIPNLYFYVNSIKMDDYVKRYTDSYGQRYHYKSRDEELWYLKLKWFADTKQKMATTIEAMQEHGYLRTKTINICTPLDRDNEFRGVYCGIIRADSLFDKIKSLETPKGSYYLIMDKDGKVLVELNNSDLKLENIKDTFVANFTNKFTQSDGGMVTVEKIGDFEWYIIAGIQESDIDNEAMKVFLKHAALILVFFVIFIAIVNGAYTFLHSRADAKKGEYEKMLEYSSRMSEIGELVSAINHQLRQPINSLTLIISNTLKLLSREDLNKKTIENNLKLSKKSINLMNKTIDIFRNFYRSDSTIREFYLKNTVRDVLHVVYTNTSQKNIAISVHDENIKNLKMTSIESFIEQILLVLIQNAIDAIDPMTDLKDINRRKIEIRFEVHEKSVDIDVIDFGHGVKKGFEKNIFSAFYKSHKEHGFGMGLFFAKKLAKKKLMGDIELVQNSNPTIFRFSIRKVCRV